MAKLVFQNIFFHNIVDTTYRCICCRMYRKMSVGKKLETTETPAYEKTDSMYAYSKKQTVAVLQQLLTIRKFTAISIVDKCKSLLLVNGKVMTDNYNLCYNAGIQNPTLLQHPGILAQRNLSKKLELLRDVPMDINEVASLLYMDYSKLEVLINTNFRNNQTNRINVLSEELDMSVPEICSMLCQKQFLATIRLDILRNNIKTLLKYGITLYEIKNDLWVLRYNSETIKRRLDKAKEVNVGKIKTWMVRCKPEIFTHYVERRTVNKEILGNSSLAEYLSQRLECTVEDAKLLLDKQPAIKSKSMKGMKETLDFLFCEGFRPHQIIRVPKVLLHSVETMKERLQELRPYGRELDSLYMLTKSRKQFEEFLEILQKGSKKIKNPN